MDSFDLVVIGRGFGYPWSDWDAMCEAALFECGRPVLITPEAGPKSVGEQAAGTREGHLIVRIG